jgi:hypothetical protein
MTKGKVVKAMVDWRQKRTTNNQHKAMVDLTDDKGQNGKRSDGRLDDGRLDD